MNTTCLEQRIYTAVMDTPKDDSRLRNLQRLKLVELLLDCQLCRVSMSKYIATCLSRQPQECHHHGRSKSSLLLPFPVSLKAFVSNQGYPDGYDNQEKDDDKEDNNEARYKE